MNKGINGGGNPKNGNSRNSSIVKSLWPDFVDYLNVAVSEGKFDDQVDEELESLNELYKAYKDDQHKKAIGNGLSTLSSFEEVNFENVDHDDEDDVDNYDYDPSYSNDATARARGLNLFNDKDDRSLSVVVIPAAESRHNAASSLSVEPVRLSFRKNTETSPAASSQSSKSTPKPQEKRVRFQSQVEVVSLPSSEYKYAKSARKGTWVAAPMTDILWNGEEERFWEVELTEEQLKAMIRAKKSEKIQRFKNLVVDFFNSRFKRNKKTGNKDALDKVANTNVQRIHEDSVVSPQTISTESSITSQEVVSRSEESVESEQEEPKYHYSQNPKQMQKQPSFSSYESLFKESMTELFEFENPALSSFGTNLNEESPQNNELQSNDTNKRQSLSKSQIGAIQSVGKVFGKDLSPRRKSGTFDPTLPSINLASTASENDNGSPGISSDSNPALPPGIYLPKQRVSFGKAVHQNIIQQRERAARKILPGYLRSWFVVLFFVLPLQILAIGDLIPRLYQNVSHPKSFNFGPNQYQGMYPKSDRSSIWHAYIISIELVIFDCKLLMLS